ncbi:hypothetical protein O1R50_22765 [Glycomyces luteolus]|uniref:Uncharacterized protein n=1 Tax=Glycomyces luteolus TaxID=2670330 RepID=A0A9X3PEX7_9ACTN|nr:hypothetical protein [Glycomyces luteolus]MDA1362462.1 hypothetical protein [Glycomyces luteolus]
MEVRICTDGDHGDELRMLNSWLSNEPELRGRVKLERSAPGATELGAVVEAVIVALGAGGTGSILASSLVTWIKSRRTTVRLKVQVSSKTVELELATVDDVGPVLKQVLDVVTDD